MARTAVDPQARATLLHMAQVWFRLAEDHAGDAEANAAIAVREVVTLTLEHTWDGRAVDMIDAGKKKAAELAKQF